MLLVSSSLEEAPKARVEFYNLIRGTINKSFGFMVSTNQILCTFLGILHPRGLPAIIRSVLFTTIVWVYHKD